MLKSVLIFFIGFLFGAGTIGVTVSAETILDETGFTGSATENFMEKIVSPIKAKQKAKLPGTKKYMVRTSNGDYNVDTFEFSKTESCIYTDNNIIICGNFTISLY